MSQHIDIDYLKSWEGRTETQHDSMDPFKARALAAILNRANLPEAGDALPTGWQWLYFLATPASADIGADGHPTTGRFLPPSPLPRRMWAAGKIQNVKPVLLGQLAEKTSTVKSVDLKQGKSGNLLFVTVQHVFTQADELCITEEQNIVYRDMPTQAVPLPAGEMPKGNSQWSRELVPDAVMLFRFSSLTYNSHRIHYDRDYAMNNEFYPGLVVHAPLLANLLAEHATSQFPSADIVDFSFRAQRPSFEGRALMLCGTRDGNKLSLWTQDTDGFVGMKASATILGG